MGGRFTVSTAALSTQRVACRGPARRLLDQAAHDLLDEQRVPPGARQDEIARPTKAGLPASRTGRRPAALSRPGRAGRAGSRSLRRPAEPACSPPAGAPAAASGAGRRAGRRCCADRSTEAWSAQWRSSTITSNGPCSRRRSTSSARGEDDLALELLGIESRGRPSSKPSRELSIGETAWAIAASAPSSLRPSASFSRATIQRSPTRRRSPLGTTRRTRRRWAPRVTSSSPGAPRCDARRPAALQSGEELRNQPRLAAAGSPTKLTTCAPPACMRCEGGQQLSELVVASDHRRGEPGAASPRADRGSASAPTQPGATAIGSALPRSARPAGSRRSDGRQPQ